MEYNRSNNAFRSFGKLGLREQLSIIFLLSGTFMAATGFVVDYFAGIDLILMIPHLIVVLGCLFIPIFGSKKLERNTVILVFFVAIVYFPFLFFTCNGNNGVAPFLFVMVMIYFAFFFNKRSIIITYIILILYYVTIMYLGYKMPKYVIKYEDPAQIFTDKLLGVVLVSFALSVVAHITFRRYREQEEKTHELLIELEKRNEELISLSKIDKLTKVYNRHYFYEEAEKELQKSKETDLNFSLFMVDIDHFKKINDAHGHLYGDKILRLVASELKNNVREHDIVARYGGEEFIILVTDEESEETSREVAERIRESVENIIYRNEKVVTISIGVSSNRERNTLQGIIALADERLYRAKDNGRNQVVYENN